MRDGASDGTFTPGNTPPTRFKGSAPE
jgi:hypothetical protein